MPEADKRLGIPRGGAKDELLEHQVRVCANVSPLIVLGS